MVDVGPSEGKDAPMKIRTLSRHGAPWGFGLLALRAVTGCIAATTERDHDDSMGRTTAAVKAALGGVETDVEAMRFELFACPDTAHPDGDLDGVPDGTNAAQMLDSPLAPGFLPS